MNFNLLRNHRILLIDDNPAIHEEFRKILETTAQMPRILGFTDRLVILKKPFENIEVLQLAIALTEKWRLHQHD